jgi:hypothetical protein
MGRGPGVVQSWLLHHLPINGGNAATQVDELASTNDLAAEFYRTTCPAQWQVSSVRRALRALEERGLAERWSPQLGRPGGPSFWSRPAV